MSVTIPLSQLPPDEITISTQFNDLRVTADPTRQCFADLKELALFGKRTVIRDADVVNNLPLLELVNDPTFGVQQAVREEVFVFARRERLSVDQELTTSFTQVNEAAGRNRANPELYDDLKIPIAKFDDFVSDVPVALVRNTPSDDRFSVHVQRIREKAFLESFARERLERVLADAELRSDGPLKFGLIYGPLKGTPTQTEDQKTQIAELLKLCRAAHVLTIPAMHGLAPTTANDDLEPEHVSIVLGTTVEEQGKRSHLDPDWYELFPKFSLVKSSLLDVPFSEILALRNTDEGVEYRIEMTLAQAAWGTPAFQKAYTRYLKALERYMIEGHVRGGIEWLDWQKTYAEKSVARDKKFQTLMWSLLKGGVPVMAAVEAAKYVHLIPHSILPGMGPQLVPLATGLLTSTATAGLSHIFERDPVINPYPLSRLLSGTTYSPRKP